MEERKSYTATLLLSFFLGTLGIHRFYTGHVAIGVVQLLTGGCCGIWSLIDFIMICFNKFKDAGDQELADVNPTLGKIMFFVWIALFILVWVIYGTMLAELIKAFQGV